MTPFLALHGFTGSPSELSFLLERVERAGFDVRAPLLPGHGTTPRDLQNRTFAEWLACARAELERCESAIVCGFSMGSLLALSLAADDETRSRVRALVLLGCALRLSPPLRFAFGAATRAHVRLPDVYVPKPFGPDIRDKTLASSIDSYERQPVRAAMEVYRAGLALAPRLARITCPTLLVHGERDRVCDVRGAREVAGALGTEDVRLRTYARSAHMIALDFDREAVADDVIAFATRVQLREPRPVEP